MKTTNRFNNFEVQEAEVLAVKVSVSQMAAQKDKQSLVVSAAIVTLQ